MDMPNVELPEAQQEVLDAALIQSNYNSYAATSQQLIDNLQYRVDQLEVERGLIQVRIVELCSQDWTPSVLSIRDALFPNRKDVERGVQRRRDDRKRDAR